MSILNNYEKISDDFSNFVLNYALYLLHPFITKKHGPGHKGGKKEVRRQRNVD